MIIADCCATRRTFRRLKASTAMTKAKKQLSTFLGKRRAKQYIRKALSFGVRSGYLIPADPQGNVLRVCSTLDTGSCIESSRTSDAESRRRRRIARRGERRLATIDDRKAMRRGILRDKWRQATDGEQLSGLRKKQEKHLVQNRVKSLSTIGSSPRRSPQKSSLRAKNKPKTEPRRKRLVKFFASTTRANNPLTIINFFLFFLLMGFPGYPGSRLISGP